MATRRWQAGALFVAVLLSGIGYACKSAAQDDGEPIRFDYAADATCPSREEMLSRIAAYTTRWSLAPETEARRQFVVRVDRHGKTYSGRFALTSNGRETARRAIEGEHCSDVATGLAIAVALAIDPHASFAPRDEAPARAAPEAPPGTATPDAAPPPSPALDAARTQPAPAWRAPPRERPHLVAASGPPAVAVALGARAEANGAISGVLADIGIFVETAFRAPIARVPWLAPAVRLGVKQSFTRIAEVGASRVEIDWKAAFIEACPARAALGPRLHVDGCVTAHAGLLSGEVRNVAGAELTRRPWFDYGALAGVRWLPHAKVFAEIVGGVVIPLVRDRFRVEPDGLVTLAPAMGWSLGVGGGWRL